MINFEKDFKAKDINGEEYTGKIAGYPNKVLIKCQDNKNNVFQNLILISDLKNITSFKLCNNLIEIKNKFYQLFGENIKVDNQKNYLRLYLDIPNDEITKIVSKVLTLSREYSEEEKEKLNCSELIKIRDDSDDDIEERENEEENKEEKKADLTDLEKMKKEKEKYHSSCIHSMLILKDERLVSSSWDGTINIYDKNNYYVTMKINAHKDQINQITLLSDGNNASCSNDKTINIYKIEENKYTLIQTLSGHTDAVFKILELNQNLLITGSNSEIKFWKKENEKWVIDSNYKDIKCESQVVDIIKINDNEIMSYCQNSFDFWKIESGKEHTKIINIPTSCGWPYNSLLITMNENIAIAGGNSGDSALQIIDLKNRKKIKDINYSNQISSIVKVSDSIFFGGDKNGNIIRFEYNISNNNVTSNIIGKVHNSSINCIILDLKGKIISGSEDKSIKIWDSLTMIPLDLLNPENFEKIKKEINIKEETILKKNEIIRKNLLNKDLFLCPKCFKNIPLFFSFEIDSKKEIYVNFTCYCNQENKIQKMKLNDILNSWKNNTFAVCKCNSHKKEGKFCPKCKRWLCPDCIPVHNDIKGSHSDLISKIELIFNKNCDKHENKKCIGFCCSCNSEICTTCAGFFNDGHKKYTNEDKWKEIYENLNFQSVSEFKNIVKKMSYKILNYKNQQIEKLNQIIKKIEEIKNNINVEYEKIEKNNVDLTTYYTNLFNTFFNYGNMSSHYLNETVTRFQFNKYFFITEKEGNDTFDEISRSTFETFKTCNLYNMEFCPEIKIDESLYELNVNKNNNTDHIYSIIQLKNKDIAVGLYNSKKVIFYDFNFKEITDKTINTDGYVTSLCEISKNRIAIGNYSPYNIAIYDISQKNVIKKIQTLEGHQNRINSIIEINDNYIVSGGNDNPYELFVWDINNYKLNQKLSGHGNYINCITKLKKDNFYASGSQDKYVIIWNGTSNYRKFGFNHEVKNLSSLSLDKIIIIDSVRNIWIYNYEKGNQIYHFSSIHSNNINSVVSLNDNRIITAGSDNLIAIYEPDQYKMQYHKFVYCLHNNTSIDSLYITKNGNLVSGDAKGFIKVWTPQNHEIIQKQKINEKNEKLEVFTDSSFINENDRKMLLDWILPNNNNHCIKTQLLYRASSHGDNPSSFHSYCDNKGPTITIFRNYNTGYILGGYTNFSWQSDNTGSHNDPNAFLFSINNKKKFCTKNKNGYYAIYLHSSYGPYFGGTEFYFHSSGNWRSSNNVYCCNNNYYESTIKELINVDTTSTQSFRIYDVEVYLIKF